MNTSSSYSNCWSFKKGKTGRFAKSMFHSIRSHLEATCTAMVTDKMYYLGDGGEGLQVPCSLHIMRLKTFPSVLNTTTWFDERKCLIKFTHCRDFPSEVSEENGRTGIKIGFEIMNIRVIGVPRYREYTAKDTTQPILIETRWVHRCGDIQINLRNQLPLLAFSQNGTEWRWNNYRTTWSCNS